MQQTQQLRDTAQALVLKFVICLWIGVCRGRFYVLPQEVAELIDGVPQVFDQTAVEQPVENLGLVTATGAFEGLPLQLHRQGAELLANPYNTFLSILHFLTSFLLDVETGAERISVENVRQQQGVLSRRVAGGVGCSSASKEL